MNPSQKLLTGGEEDEQYFTADPSLAPKPFVPMSLEELAMASTPSATPASAESVILNNLAAPVDNRVEEKTVAGEMGKYVGAPRQVTVPQVDIGKYDVPVDAGRQNAFKDSLTQLRDDYKLAQEDARSRQMKVEMMNAVKDNIGTIVGGAQAMNTKASVTPYQGKPSVTPDFVGRADKNFKDNYSNLLKQYKDLQGGGLSADKKLYADIVNKQLQMQGIRAEANSENQYFNRGLRVGSAGMDEQDKSKLTPAQIKDMSGYDDTLASLDRIEIKKAKIDTGPVRNLQNKFASIIGRDDPEVTSLRTEVIDTLASKIKALSGTAANEGEVARLQITLPDINDSDEVFNKKLSDARIRIQEAKQIRENHYRNLQGKNVDGFKGQPQGRPSAPSTVERKTKDGKIAIYDAATKEFIKYKE